MSHVPRFFATLHRQLRIALLPALSLVAMQAPVHAQTMPSAVAQAPAASPASSTDDTLYQALGGTAGIQKLMEAFVRDLVADPRTSPFFKPLDLDHLRAQLSDQVCQVSGGPCLYQGTPMKKAHAGVDITRRDFNALVEVLQHSMDEAQIPFRTQNALLARLAPMHRDIVNAP